MGTIPSTSGIYAITNTVNGKQYVGSTGHSLRQRRAQHFSKLRKGTHNNPHLQAAFCKYGENAFSFMVLEECTPDQCVAREQYWIDTLGTIQQGYNIRVQAESNRGLQVPPHLSKIRSQLTTAMWADLETRARIIAAGRAAFDADPTIRERIAISSRGRSHSPEARASIAAAQRARYADPAERARASQRAHERYTDPAERGRSGEHFRQYYSDPAARERAAVARRGCIASPETRALQTQRAAARYSDPERKAAILQKRRETIAQRKAERAAETSPPDAHSPAGTEGT